MIDTPRLVFGDDRSPGSEVCWGWIDAQRWPGWRLEVVTAHMPAAGPPLPATETTLHPWSPEQPRVPSPTTGFTVVEHLTAEADPRLALDRPADLLAVGPRGPGLLKALHLGSTAEWLLEQPPAPLVMARLAAPVRTALVCHDGSEHAQAATEALARLPWTADVAVTVLAIDDGRVDAGAAIERARAVLADRTAGFDASTVAGRPTASIHDAIEGRRPDLVVLGTRGLTGLHRLRVGSTAGAVARSARCSVLVARPGEPVVSG